MSRSRERGCCPNGKRNCGVGCSRSGLNAVRDFKQTPELDLDLEPEHVCVDRECLLCGVVACGECELSAARCPHGVTS